MHGRRGAEPPRSSPRCTTRLPCARRRPQRASPARRAGILRVLQQPVAKDALVHLIPIGGFEEVGDSRAYTVLLDDHHPMASDTAPDRPSCGLEPRSMQIEILVVGDAHRDVDDRLGAHPGDRRGSDVFDEPVRIPVAAQFRRDTCEGLRPRRVVRNEHGLHVRRRRRRSDPSGGGAASRPGGPRPPMSAPGTPGRSAAAPGSASPRSGAHRRSH